VEKLQNPSIRLPLKKISIVFAAVCLVQFAGPSPSVFAAGPVPAPSRAATPLQFDYPELQMTPLMSERIERESTFEGDSKWTRLVPIQTSALLMTTAGVLQLAAWDGYNALPYQTGVTALSIGVAQLAATALVSSMYLPYAASKSDLKQNAGTAPRDRLARERYAEESIEAAARVGRILTWVTVVPNAVVSAGVTYSALMMGERGQAALTAGAVSFAGSLLPLLFPTRWQLVAGEQADYKKRIYGPLGEQGGIGLELAASPMFTQDRLGRSEASPGLLATLRF
jgi:hypothetical protein